MKRSRGLDFFDAQQLETALASNRELQATVAAEIERLVQAQASNRRQAASLTQELISLQKQQITQETTTATACLTPPFPAIDYERKWSRRFFVDSDGSEPEPNADARKRREWEATNNSFCYHLRPPWTKKETKDLKDVIASSASTLFTNSNTSNDVLNSFEPVAVALEEKRQLALAKSRQKNVLLLARTAEECQVQYNNQVLNTKALTKSETKMIRQQVDEHKFSADTDAAVEGQTAVDWGAVAGSFSTPQHPRTPFDCLAAFKSSQSNSRWTPLEDEVLLKFLAATGPQSVLEFNKNTLLQQNLLVNLLHTKSKAQILNRANLSLLNPRFKSDRWSEAEERRLPILMKIYHNHAAARASSDTFRTALHFDRNSKAVVDKWNRTLNPEYSTRPFSAQEDEQLLALVRANRSIGWAELSRDHMPHRHHQRLSSRWQEICTDQDVLSRERALLAVKRGSSTANAD